MLKQNIKNLLKDERVAKARDIGHTLVFLDDEMIDKSAMQSHQREDGKVKRIVKSILKKFRPPHHSVYFDTLESSTNEGETLIKFLQGFEEGSNILNIGSLSKKIDGSKGNIINLDISFYPNIDIVADAHDLPFKDASLDGIIIKNVFEHLRNPIVVLAEIRRVLKKGGLMYAKIPFMQPFHAVPDDYQRYSINGIFEFLKEFEIVEDGISVGPSSALAWFLIEYLGILFSFNTERGYKIAKGFFSYLVAPIKYYDIFFKNKKHAQKLASAFYVIAKR
ncbi:class I SAM-dependent methyltransferase [Patescibacteria group bacterium]|nr:class I SAM-dependent methyltransferase [Patescibacteria group bacterium]